MRGPQAGACPRVSQKQLCSRGVFVPHLNSNYIQYRGENKPLCLVLCTIKTMKRCDAETADQGLLCCCFSISIILSFDLLFL